MQTMESRDGPEYAREGEIQSHSWGGLGQGLAGGQCGVRPCGFLFCLPQFSQDKSRQSHQLRVRMGRKGQTFQESRDGMK